MSSLELAKRNAKFTYRDPLSLAVNAVLPVLLLVVLQGLEDTDDFFSPASLAPGVVVFGFAMLTMTSAMSLAQDRERSLFDRMLTTPLRARDFVIAYSAPYLVVAGVQAAAVFSVAGVFGMRVEGSPVVVVVPMAAMAVLYVGLGMLIGATVSYRAVTGPWMVVLLATIFGGTWVDLAEIGGAFERVAAILPVAHALDATRAVVIEGSTIGDVAGDVLWVVGYTVLVATGALVVFRRRMMR